MTISSAVSNGEVFLQGTYLGIGINEWGGLGTTKNAPKGFASDADSGYLRTGMVADLDGFGKGQETTLDDALLQGRAIEGFNIGYNLGSTKVVQSNQLLTGYYQVKGSLSEASSKGNGVANWAGETKDNLGVAQTITLADDAKYIRIDVVLTNNSSSTMSDVRYMRTADPDQSGKYATTNKIEQQDSKGALVTALLQKDTPFFLYSQDSRADASFYGFVNLDPYAASATSQAEGYTKTVDQTLNLTFSLGTLRAGQSTKITMYMGVTDNLSATISQINSGTVTSPPPPPPPVENLAPIAVADAFSGKEDGRLSGNVLSNDRDPEGKSLSASLVDGPSNGTIQFSADGSFVYVPKTGWNGSDSFVYAASDGVNKTSAVVKLTVDAAPVIIDPVTDPTLDLIQNYNIINGSHTDNQVLRGTAGSDAFYFEAAASSGNDRVVNFGSDDLLVFDKKLYDGNNDNLIRLTNNRVTIDASGDTVQVDGVSVLRLLGSDDEGHFFYRDDSIRPRGAKEGTFANNVFNGDAANESRNMFFFDTRLGIDLGDDTINRFGKDDLIITTTKLFDGNNDGIIMGSKGNLSLPDGTGTVSLTDIDGNALTTVEFDGSVTNDGITYYVYSLVGSNAGLGGLVLI
ncbi:MULTISPECIES: Ig-like domain-containing protein [unclassified Sphingomonas]|uniref:Ig-like domain-containing protein n=1 Tax=unclassified Sphingomonas TaxID=196159 RepID=UPI000B29E95A|nr:MULTISPECIES: Ig-like domain-containing protein [unclassified Sphingomonas]